uniref:Uncharacterized protein n=1 Tax=Oryza glumipatula TaxID=40148 RepID=A0A0D9YP73_9ORYZ
MGAAWLGVGLQAILVMFLLMSPPFLPCALAAGYSSEGKSGDQGVANGEDGRHNPPFSPGHK